MANFRFKKQTIGKTTEMFKVPVTGTVAIGDLLDSTGAAADASDTAIEFLAQESGTGGDSPLLAMPIISGVTILEGTVDADSGVSQGDAVGIDANQLIDQNAANSLFIVLDDAGTGEDVRVLVTAGL